MKKTMFFSLGIFALLVSFSAIINRAPAKSFIQNGTQEPPPTPEPTLTTLPTVNIEQLLGSYHSTLETTKWVFTVAISIITIFGVMGGIAGVKVYERISDAAKRADDASLSVNRIRENSEMAIKNVNETLMKICEAENQISSLKSKSDSIIQEIIKWRSAAKKDLENHRNSLLLVQIEEYSIDLFSDDHQAKWRAKRALIAMTDPNRAACIRRRSVRALGRFVQEEPEPQIIERLKQVAENDLSLSVRRSALEALSQLD